MGGVRVVHHRTVRGGRDSRLVLLVATTTKSFRIADQGLLVIIHSIHPPIDLSSALPPFPTDSAQLIPTALAGPGCLRE